MIAVENARLFEEVQARTHELTQSVEELRALGVVSQAVNSTLDLQTVLDTIVAKAAQISGTEAGAIYVLDERQGEFQLRATYGMSEELIAAVRNMHAGISKAVGHATEAHEPEQVADLRDLPATLVNDTILCAGYRARLLVPLLRSGEVVGALVVRRKAPGEFRPTRSTCSRPSPPSRCWRSRMRACSRRSRRKAASSQRRASTSRSSSLASATNCARRSTPSSASPR